MTERLICLACLVIGYGFGLIQVAHIYSKAKNINIREKGSGNAGTTNMFRVMGIKAGIITLVGDCAKLVAAMIFTKLIFLTGLGFQIDPTALALYTGLGCVLGHDFPFYFHFKGGKGVASSCGVMLFCFPVPAIICYIVTIAVIALTRFVSLGSMILLTLYAILVSLFWANGNIWIILWSVFLAALCIYRHRANIARLLSGTENKLGKK